MRQTTGRRFIKRWGKAIDALNDVIHTGRGEQLPPALLKGQEAAKKAMDALMEAESYVGEWAASGGQE